MFIVSNVDYMIDYLHKSQPNYISQVMPFPIKCMTFPLDKMALASIRQDTKTFDEY